MVREAAMSNQSEERKAVVEQAIYAAEKLAAGIETVHSTTFNSRGKAIAQMRQALADFALLQTEELRKRVKELEQADIKRVQDISRLTVDRDDARNEAERLKLALERCLSDAQDINGYAAKDSGGHGERLLKVMGHTTGMIIRLERELAALNTPGGG